MNIIKTHKNMKTNKETRMISSDEIFYAVLKDGTVVSNFREAAESMETGHAIDLVEKVLAISLDLSDEAKTFTTDTQARLLLVKAGLKVQSRIEARREAHKAKVKADAEQKDETDNRNEYGGE